jgi:phospholipid-binding lipoprotein MlaA
MSLLRVRLAAMLCAAVLATGCATTGGAMSAASGAMPTGAAAGAAGGDLAATTLAINPIDPWERLNRRVYAFNDAVDSAVLRPVAEGYVNVVPSPVRRAVGNFFGNFGDAWSAVNHLLQGQLESAMVSIVRFGTNTSLGLGGLIDIAGEAGVDRRRADFGQTLGVWGVPSGPYMVLPVFGPSTVRETAAFVPDRAVGPTLLVDGAGAQAAVTSLGVVDTRATLLPATRMLDSIALDKYVFVRDAYLQRRQNAIDDVRGAPSAGTNPTGDGPKPAASTEERMRAPGQPSGLPAR